MSDDSKDFAASQQAHADRARVIREVSHHSNVPANQVRQALRQSDRVAARQERAPQPPAPISRTSPELFGPSPEVRKFEPRPFAQQNQNGAGPQQQSTQRGTLKGIVVVSGVAKYYNFSADYDSDV